MVKKGLCCLSMLEIRGSCRSTNAPRSSTSIFKKVKKGGGEATTTDQNTQAYVALCSEISIQIQQPRHSWHPSQEALRRPFYLCWGPRNSAHRLQLYTESRPQLGLLWHSDERLPQRGDVCLPQGNTHLPVQTINSLFPKRGSCWAELQFGSTGFLRPDTTVPSGVSLVF